MFDFSGLFFGHRQISFESSSGKKRVKNGSSHIENLGHKKVITTCLVVTGSCERSTYSVKLLLLLSSDIHKIRMNYAGRTIMIAIKHRNS